MTSEKNNKKFLYVSIAGIIGSGKSTAAKLLAKDLGFNIFEEIVNENKFLPLYYKDPKRWSLHSQLFYLFTKAEQLSKINVLLAKNGIVQDSPIHQDYLTYAKAQHILGHMNRDEFNLYEKYFNSEKKNIPTPHLIVQLDASVDTLVGRIKERNRDYEKATNRPYLELLSKLQKEWISGYPDSNILNINTDELNLSSNKEHQKKFTGLVRNKLEI